MHLVFLSKKEVNLDGIISLSLRKVKDLFGLERLYKKKESSSLSKRLPDRLVSKNCLTVLFDKILK